MNTLLAVAWPLSEAVVERLGWTLVHSLWQFALVALLSGVAVRAVRRNSSTLRYGVLVTAMVVSVAAPMTTWWLMPRDIPTTLASSVAMAPEQDLGDAMDPRTGVLRLARDALLASDQKRQSPATDTAASETQPGVFPQSTAILNPESSWSVRTKTAVRPWLTWIVAGWSLGVVVCSVRPLLGWHTLRRLKRVGISPVPDDVFAALHRVSKRLGLRDAVQLLQSTLAQVPIVVGYFRPVILLPVSLVTSIPASQLEAILAHELAHVQRHDFVVNLLQTLVETLFFYHPAVWWLSHQIRIEREHCCDDLVVKLLDNRVEYGRALVAIEQQRGKHSVLALGAADGSLLSRVRRIVGSNSERTASSQVERWPAALLGIVLLGISIVLSMTWNLAAKDEPKAEPAVSVSTEQLPPLTFVATFPDGAIVELLAVDSESSQKDTQSWRPDGGPLLNKIEWPTKTSQSTKHTHDLIVRFSGLPAGQKIGWRVDRFVFGPNRSDTNPWTARISIDTAEKETELRIGLTETEWGPWQKVDAAGKLVDLVEVPRVCQDAYSQIQPDHVEQLTGHTRLNWRNAPPIDDRAMTEVVAVDNEGKKHAPYGFSLWGVANPQRSDVFQLPLEQIDHFEYRHLPFRQWATFRHVALQQGLITDVKVKRVSVSDGKSIETSMIQTGAIRPGEWPMWGGSSHRNHVASGRLPTEWDLKTGRNVQWNAKLGTATYASPVVSGGKVFLGTNNGAGLDSRRPKETDLSCLLCLDQTTGKLLWQHASEKLPQGRAHDWPEIGLCSTACVDGDRLWVVTNRCEVVCLDTNGFRDGENDGDFTAETDRTEMDADVVWKFDMFGTLGVRPLHQAVSSITIVDGVVLLNTSNGPDESRQNVPAPKAPHFLALDARTGRVVWQDNSAGESILVGGSSCGCSGTSPAVATIGGVTQAIFAGREGWLYGFDFADLKQGKTTRLWQFDCNPKTSKYSVGGKSTRNTLVASPVVVGDRVYIATGRNPEEGEGPGDLWCIDPQKRGDISSEQVFNKSHRDGQEPIPHKPLVACDPKQGDFTRPNPNSGAIWHYVGADRNGDGKLGFDEAFHRSISNPTIHDGLLFIPDFSGLLHCVDARTGEGLWTHDLLAAVWSSCVIVEGRVLIGDEDGDIAIFNATRTYQPVHDEPANLGSPIYSTPAVVNRTLFVAAKDRLVAIGGEQPNAPPPQAVPGNENPAEKPANSGVPTQAAAGIENQLGTLSGRFVYDGEPPARKDLYSSFAKIDVRQPQQPGPDGRFHGVEAVYRDFLKHNIRPQTEDVSLLVGKDGGIANVVVWVVSQDIPWSRPQGEFAPAVIQLKDGNFSPRFAAVTVGQPLLIENKDPLALNFAAEFSRALNSSFNVLLPPGITVHRVTFRAPEPYPAAYSSSLAPWASGRVFVHSNPFVAVSQPDGSFTLPNLPAGDWEFQVWHERGGFVQHWPKGRFKQSIKPGDNMLGTIKLKPEHLGQQPATATTPPKNREQVGEVLGKPVYRDEVKDDTLQAIFLSPVLAKYQDAHRAAVTPTEVEIKFAAEFFDNEHRKRLDAAGGEAKIREQMKALEERLAGSDLPNDEQQKLELAHRALRHNLKPPGRFFAEFMLNKWKFQKHLYDEFGGGRILWQQAGQEAFDATRTCLESLEKKGEFKITDTALRAKLFEYWTRSHGSFLTDDKERIRSQFLEPPWIAPGAADHNPSGN